jgi:hypothetical protein
MSRAAIAPAKMISLVTGSFLSDNTASIVRCAYRPFMTLTQGPPIIHAFRLNQDEVGN